MSAIFGTYNFENTPVITSQIEAMSNILSHRGSNENRIWIDKSIGLGNRMCWTTPESFHEKLPKTSENGNFTITADARIDNREDLFKQLEIHQYKDEVITDSEIILLAYQKWGERCPEKLLGDFAFAIWDKSRNSLFCVRDHFGVKPFYFYKSEKLFAFATEIKAFFCLPEITRILNEEMVANYLISNFEDKSATFYQNILRLPPGCSLKIANGNLTKRTYFELDLNRELPSLSNEEYAEGLREIFTEAVRCRMRSNGPIGSKLSGGLDSSSIACVARDLLQSENNQKLPTFSMVYDRLKECDERKYIDLILAQGGFDSHLILADNHSPLKNLEAISWHTDSPVIGPGFSSAWEFNKSIVNSGVKIIFDGHDGDNAVSYGYNYLDELAQDGKWFELARQAKGLSEVFLMSRRKIVTDYFDHYRWRPFLKKHPKAKILQRIGRRLSHPKSSLPTVTNFSIMSNLVNKDFAERVNLTEKYSSAKKSLINRSRTAREFHYYSITSGGQSFALEQCDAFAAAFGIEVRYPFWDKRLIEYCLALPGEQKCNEGWNRIVMRRAMKNILPDEVCWRKNKTDFTPSIIDGIIYDKQETLRKIIDSKIDNNNYFDNKTLSETYRKLNSEITNKNDMNSNKTVREFWEIASLFSWLQSLPAKGNYKEVSVM